MIPERPRQFFFFCLTAIFVFLYLILYHIESDNYWVTEITSYDDTSTWHSNRSFNDEYEAIYGDQSRVDYDPKSTETKSAEVGTLLQITDVQKDLPDSVHNDVEISNDLQNDNNIIVFENIYEASVRPTANESSRQIFFIETSHPEGANLELNERKACAIESAAFHHPNYKIYVIIAGKTTIDLNSNWSRTYKNLVDNYPNVFFRSMIPHEFMRDTPLANFHKWRQLNRSKNYNVYLADILRLVALYKYGGLYFDTDVVVLRNFEDLGENYLCSASHYLLMSGTMLFSAKDFGHHVVGSFLKNAANEFNARDWASNGPTLVTRVMKRICNATNTNRMNVESCKGIKILPRNIFLPVPYKQHLRYFAPKWGPFVLRVVKDSYTAHIFNHMNGHLKLKTSERAGYVMLAEKHCPHVYENLGEYF